MRIPINTNIPICIIPSAPVSIDSGSRCKKAPPSKAPEARATSQSKILFRSLSLRARKKIPTKAIRLTIITEIKIQSNIFSVSPYFII